MHAGYRWFLLQRDGLWAWKVVVRDGEAVIAEGLARTRAEGAAYLARTMSLATVAAEAPSAA